MTRSLFGFISDVHCFCVSPYHRHGHDRSSYSRAGGAERHPGKALWQVQDRGLWWDLEPAVCDAIERARLQGAHELAYVWDWGWQRPCNWIQPGETEPSTLARYRLDFARSVQVNMDTITERRL